MAGARVLGLTFERLGWSWKPYPHPYVAVSRVPDRRSALIFLAAGSAFTLLVTLVGLATGLMDWKPFALAIGIQWVIETNPFYSDITLAANGFASRTRLGAYLQANQPEYVARYGLDRLIAYHRSSIDATVSRYVNLYSFTLGWYVHFAAWLLLVGWMTR
jgi:hypothetical protein